MQSGYIISTISAVSDTGLVRESNNDSFLLADLSNGNSLSDSCQITKKLNDNRIFLAVSDGMGVSQFGMLASELALLAIKDALQMPSAQPNVGEQLITAVELANQQLWMDNKMHPKAKMKATATVALIDKSRAYIANIGDSRAYLLREDRIKQLTTDQTISGMLISEGKLNPAEIGKHPGSSNILQAIGNSQTLQVAIDTIDLAHNDILLLCTDGLSNHFFDRDLYELATFHDNPAVVCKKMIEAAKQQGGDDNITAIIAKFECTDLPFQKRQRITHDMRQLQAFDTQPDPARKTKLPLPSNEVLRLANILPIRVETVDTLGESFIEQTETLQVSRMDASFLLNHPVDVDDLLYLTLPMPKELRLFDEKEQFYRLYAQVRKTNPQSPGKYFVRVAFISKDHPDSAQ